MALLVKEAMLPEELPSLSCRKPLTIALDLLQLRDDLPNEELEGSAILRGESVKDHLLSGLELTKAHVFILLWTMRKIEEAHCQ